MSRKNVSLSQAIEQRAQALIKARGFSGLSDLLATLIREEYERRNPPSSLQEGGPAPTPPTPPEKPVTYSKRKRRHGAGTINDC